MSSEPTLNNNKNQEFSSPNLDVVDNDKQKAVSAPQTINPSDPFDFFHGDIAYRIISELDAADTELLRRVSKLWKATSEFCCRRTLLSQHFPEAAASLSENEMGSDEEENLRFRRHCKFLTQTAVAKETTVTFGETNPFTRSISSSELPAWIRHKNLVFRRDKFVGFEK